MEDRQTRTLTLENGVGLEIIDRTRKLAESSLKPLPDRRGTRAAFGDIWVVSLLVRARVDVAGALKGAEGPTPAEAAAVLGPSVEWEKELVRNLVHEGEKEKKRAEVEKDLETLLAYLKKPSFVKKLVVSEYERATGKPRPRFPGTRPPRRR
ncbi:MAG: hypothetical protein JRI97_11385 [Deltaproteobacteria bacterium]|nr:hypothetical protein [Deltaproteobacteria bacterium]